MKITQLNPQQKKAKSIWKQMYLDKFFKNDKIVSKEEVKEYIHWFYSTFNISKNKKPKVIIVNSPYEIYLAIHYTKSLLNIINNKGKLKLVIGNEVENEVWNEVGNEVWNEVWNEVRNEVGNEVRSEVWNEVRSEVRNEVWNEVGNEVWNEVGNEVWNEVWNEVRSEVWNELRSEVRNEVENEVRSEVWNEVWNEVGNEVRSEVWNEVRNEVGNEVENEVRSEVWNEVWNEVGNEVENEVENEVGNEVGNEVENEVRKNKLKYYNYSFYLSSFQSWISYYDFFDKNCFKLKKAEVFNRFKEILDLNIFYSITFENFVFVSRQAVKYNRDSQKRLNSVNEAAVIFGGNFGYSLYYVNGLNISKELFDKLSKQKVTFNDWIKEPNEEIKSAILSFYEQKFGNEFVFRFLSEYLKEIDTFVNKKEDKYLEGVINNDDVGVYTLFKGNINNIDLAYIRTWDYSTDRMFFLGVEPQYNNVKDAVGSLLRLPKKLIPYLESINRQGELYSTTYSTKGLAILKSLSKEELRDTQPLTGKQYFKLMEYEY